MQPTIIWNDYPLEAAVTGANDTACKVVAEKIAASAKSRCPKKTGALANSIEVKKIGGKEGGYRVIAYGDKSAGRYYASHVEMGLHKTRHMAAQPFMRPAKDKHKAELPIEYDRAFAKYER